MSNRYDEYLSQTHVDQGFSSYDDHTDYADYYDHSDDGFRTDEWHNADEHEDTD